MNICVNQVYLVGIHIPSVLNAPSPLKEVAASLPVVDAVRQENAGKGAQSVISMKRHFCIVLQYEPTTHVGTLLLGTTRPTQPHRFVPCAGTARMDYQPPYSIELTDGSQMRNGGYYNFSHALRATLVFPGDPLNKQAVPPPAFCKDTLGDSGDVIEAFVSEDEVNVLKKLHADYWIGVRYARDGTSGASGSGPGTGTSEGAGFGGAPGTGTRGTSGGGPSSGTSGTRGGSSRPINSDGTVDVPLSVVRGEGFCDSAGERLSRALEEEDERIFQMELMEGECKDLSPPKVVCYLTPWRVQGVCEFDVL